MTSLRSPLAALLSGLLLIAGFAPFDLWPLAYVALLPLFLVSRSAGPVRTMGLYALTGSVLAIGIYHGVIGYGLMALLLVTGAFSIAFALWGWLTYRITVFRPVALVVIPAPALVWVGIETLAGTAYVGVPMYLGLSQVDQSGLIQVSSWFGISGVSFLIVLVNSTLCRVLARGEPSTHKVWIGPAAVAVALLLVICLGEWRMKQPLDPAVPVRVTSIQPVIDSETYRDGWQKPENRQFMRTTMKTLTAQAIQGGARMIFWAEGGNGYMNLRVPGLRSELISEAKNNSVDLLISSGDMDSHGQRFNSVFSISEDGRVRGRYDKQRLLPLAEAGLTAGKSVQPLPTSHGLLGVAICYESVFPEPLREQTKNGAEILFVTSSDAVFKRSSLAWHHARLAEFRAIENGRWLVRAANTGPSLIVSPYGEISAQAEFYERTLLTGDVAMQNRLTFFTRVGHLLPKMIAAVTLALLGYSLWSVFRKYLLRRNIEPGKRVHSSRPVRGIVVRQTTLFTGISTLALAAQVCTSLYAMNLKAADAAPGLLESIMELAVPSEPPVEDVSAARFLQGGNNTCGAAALAYVSSYFGRETGENEILDLVQMSEAGTSLLELKRAAERLSFIGIGVSENYAALGEEALPVIAYINDSHYVVVTRVESRHVHLFDPAQGHLRLARQVFEQVWNGYLLLIRPRPIPDMGGLLADGHHSSAGLWF